MAFRRRPYNVGVVGATGFTGRLVMRRLIRNRPELRVLTSSRNPEALKSIVERLNLPGITAWEHPVSSESYSSLSEFVSLVDVVIACAGPFFDVGVPVVRACVQRGTQYVDINAEIDFIRRLVDEFGAHARSSNVLVVPACGFSGVADMGVLLAQQLAHSPITRVSNLISMKASMSGGSLKTLLAVANDENRWRLIRDVYALNENLDPVCGPGSDPTNFEADAFAVKYDGDRGTWTGPSATAAVNSRIVRRTASLARLHPERHLKLSRKFEYRELSESESFLSAVIPTTLAMLQSPVKWALSLPLINRVTEMLMPQPKEDSGPDDVTRRENWFRYRIDAQTEQNEQILIDIAGADFYDVSAETAALAAICILEGKEPIIQQLNGGGVYTPAFALGDRYLKLLKTSPLLKFEPRQAEAGVAAA